MRAVGFTYLALVSIVLSNNAMASTGRTQGDFNVSPIGSAQYSIPLWTPPGPHGIQPRLAVSYDSHGGIGPLGVGWSVSGLGSVTRCNKTYAQDGVSGSVTLSINDGYCLNGKRLRLYSGTYGNDGSTYQTEVADFSLISANGGVGSAGPASWTVKGRDGLIYQYGYVDANSNGANSQLLAGTIPYAWLLSKVTDRSGNNYVINYLAPDGMTLTNTSVPDKIQWAPTSNGAATYQYSAKFNYSTNVAASSPAKYLAGTAVADTKLLTSVAINYNTTVIRDYFLGYTTSPTTGRNELNSIKECADAAQSDCLLPTAIAYTGTTPGLGGSSSSALTSSGTGLVAKYDFNGDGIPDLIYCPDANNTYVAFGSASGYGTPVVTNAACYLAIGDFDGGSKDGFIALGASNTLYYYTYNGTTFTGTATNTTYPTGYNSVTFAAADVNGDGLPDLVWMTTSRGARIGTVNALIFGALNTTAGSAVSFATANYI